MSSRESDNAHPTPRRTGPDAYPSGTPPYGTPGPGGDRAAAAPGAASGGEDDGPRTETTLTTRVRINIPGSRPIPPVVVRSAVKNEDGPGDDAPAAASEPGSPRHRSAPASPVLGVMEDGGRSAAPPSLPPEWEMPAVPPIPSATSESESTGAWFRPRQKKTQTAEAVPAGVPAAAASAVEAPAAPAAAEPRPQGARPAARANGTPNGRPVPSQGKQSAQGKQPHPAAPAAPFRAEAPVEEPGVYEAAAPFAPVTDPFGTSVPEAGRPRQNGQSQNGRRPDTRQADGQQQNAQRHDRRQTAPQNGFQPNGQAAAEANTEDTSVDGFAPIHDHTPPPAAIPGLPRDGAPRGADAPAQPGLFASAPTGTDPFAAQRPAAPGQESPVVPAGPGALFPGAPGAAPQHGGPQLNGAPRLNGHDPEATEFTPLPTPPPAAGPRPEAAKNANANAKGKGKGNKGAKGADAPAPDLAPFLPPTLAPVPAPAPAKKAEPAAPAKAKRGGAGKKLVKLGTYGIVAVLFLGAAAYGTGLMLNQSDVPKGTVVLGAEIGGSSRDQAIHQLDESIGKAGQQPLKLKIGDQAVDLDPTVAGLSFDTTATVDGLAQHSYNPVDVIKSLQGGTKAVAPEVKVDRAKLKAALDTLTAAGSGPGLQEGYVKFSDNGEPIVVPGRAGQAVDSASALDVIEQAYRDRADGKPDQPISLAVAAAQPKVSAQALQAAADGLGKQVASGKVHVTAGTKTWDFGPKTAAKALTLVPDSSGKIVPKWDLDALSAQLGNAFDKVKVKKNGQLAAITPQDVADGVTSVFDKTGDKDRTFKFTV
ncbi:peptidoglycan binding domain-containing protein [Kitasatospora brasiliensis]|uniref:peptidoglycan binding domain-containing protein n=1 Tax=Kitasatospora brasiliensis TaxID=3058040 RepID=UPI00292D746A|nr:peptidoglycan binding domain-containing protein [Kitasatospora sp. K002]